MPIRDTLTMDGIDEEKVVLVDSFVESGFRPNDIDEHHMGGAAVKRGPSDEMHPPSSGKKEEVAAWKVAVRSEQISQAQSDNAKIAEIQASLRGTDAQMRLGTQYNSTAGKEVTVVDVITPDTPKEKPAA